MTESKDFSEPASQPQPRLSTADLAGAASTSEARRPEEERTIQQPATPDAAAAKQPDDAAPLFSPGETDKLRGQWNDIQAGFVDEPRQAVERADELVALTIKRLAEGFSNERGKMEGQWDRGGDVSTEDLRLALRRYRSFFGRLLSV